MNARAGVFVYALHLEHVAGFYEKLAGMTRLHQTDEIVVMESPDLHLLVHRIPPHIAAGITLSVPPQRREDTALKFFFTVSSIDEARKQAAALGGTVFDEKWQSTRFVVCNAMDPEGNVFQVREWLPP